MANLDDQHPLNQAINYLGNAQTAIKKLTPREGTTPEERRLIDALTDRQRNLVKQYADEVVDIWDRLDTLKDHIERSA
jgi:hypothetical protein